MKTYLQYIKENNSLDYNNIFHINEIEIKFMFNNYDTKNAIFFFYGNICLFYIIHNCIILDSDYDDTLRKLNMFDVQSFKAFFKNIFQKYHYMNRSSPFKVYNINTIFND